MEEYLIAAILISVGTYFIFFRNTAAPEEPLVRNDKVADNDNDKGEKKEDKKGEEDEDIHDDVDPSKWPKLKPLEIAIYFGSQTGTAEKYSHVLKEECRKYMGVIANVIDMEDFDLEEFKQNDLNILCVATHGEGEPTDNALRVVASLKKSVKNEEFNLVKDVEFAVYSLGDTEYENFCAMGKFFDGNLDKLGGKRVFELGMGDTSNNLEDHFNDWKQRLWPTLIERYKADDNEEQKIGAEVKLEKKSVSRKKSDTQKMSLTMRQYGKAAEVKIHSMRELKKDQKEGSCLEIIYDLTGTGIEYATAANLAVFATNRDEDVEKALGGADGDEKLHDPAFPIECTLREAFQKFIDLSGPIDKSLVKHLSHFIADEEKKAEFLNINVAELKTDRVSVLELIDKYPCIEMTAHQKLNTLPKMAPRYYTIASSSLYSPEKVRIAISLSEYKVGEKQFIGLTSSYYDRIFKTHFKDGAQSIVTSRIFFNHS